MPDLGRIVLPQPPKVYSAEYMRMLNARIEQLIKDRLARDEIAQYGGIPYIGITGSAATFTIPAGTTPTKIPFNTLMFSTDPSITLDAAAFDLTAQFTSAFGLFIRLRHNQTGGGNAEITLHGFINGVQTDAQTYDIKKNANFNIAGFFIGRLTAGQKFDLRATVSTGTFDIVPNLSRLWLLRLDYDPKLTAGRVP